MCGIAGIVTPSDAQDYRNKLVNMTDAIAHRGPDGQGHYFFSRCALGHRRLSIVDIEGSPQPMCSPSSKLGLVFNGEIYGYQELREQNPYHYRTAGDTELLLVLYEKYGTQMLSKLPGMFAFAIWDEDKQQLFCARDRFGEKPLYYALGRNGELIFASELKAILASELLTPEIDPASMAHYLKHLYVHPHTTIYKNVFMLPPAHYFVFDQRSGKINVNRYWEFPEINEKINTGDAHEQFVHLFENAVKKQLVADVPVGAFLSGGLDSSTVVAVASKYKQGIKTISFGFGDSINELPYARDIAKKYHTEHIELQQPLADIGDLLLRMNDIYDEPFADSSNIPTYLVSQQARKHLTVVLTGDGGDELLGGYGSYKVMLEMMNRKKTIPALIQAFRFYLKLRRKIGLPANEKSIQASILNALHDDFPDAHSQMNIYFSDKEIQHIGIKGTATPKRISFTPNQTPDDGMRADIEDYMPGDILAKTDRASMANSLELRAPFLDVPFAEFCLSLPYKLKLNNSSDKMILRETFGKLWTDEIRKRSKMGFGAPVNHWLKLPKVIDLKHEYLVNPKRKMYDHLDYDACRRYFGKNNYHTWTLLVLSLWFEKNIPAR